MDPGGLGFSEVLTVTNVASEGTTPIWGMNLFVSCGSTCNVAYHWPQGAPLAEGTTGSLDYTGTVAKGGVNTFKSSYVLTLVAPDFTPVTFQWKLPIPIRVTTTCPASPARDVCSPRSLPH